MKNFKKPLGLFIIAILGLTLANCKGKSESENVETPTTEISNNETVETLAEKIHQVEFVIFPKAINLVLN